MAFNRYYQQFAPFDTYMCVMLDNHVVLNTLATEHKNLMKQLYTAKGQPSYCERVGHVVLSCVVANIAIDNMIRGNK